MSALRLTNFGGELPGQEARTIPENCSVQATNVRLTSARLEPINTAESVAACKAGASTIYRLLDGTWVSWVEDVNIALSPIAGDTSHKFFFTSDSFEPRVSNSAMAQGVSPPVNWYVLGVTPPVTVPLVTTTGGAATNESRTYCYTFVTQWGEESAPSPAASLVTGHPDGAWTVTLPDVAPENTHTVTAAAWAAGVLTLTVTSTFGLRADEYVTLSGLAPAGLNASFKVASVPSTTSFTIAMGDPGVITDGAGTASRDAPHNTTGMTKRLYRSVTTATDTQFYLLGDAIPVATTTFIDGIATTSRQRTSGVATLTFASVPSWFVIGSVIMIYGVGGTGYNIEGVLTAVSGTTMTFACAGADEAITADVGGRVSFAIQEPLATLGWLMPPATLQGVLSLPSGALAGFYDNVVCFSEPSIPYAWPSAYRNTSDFPVVGLSAIGTAVVVGTRGTPYVLDGVEPASATMSRINQLWPCLAKNGMVSFNNGVYYPTTVGLAMVSMSGSGIVTEGMYTQYEWSALAPSTFIAATFANMYYTVDVVDGTTRVLVVTPNKWVTEYNVPADTLYTDEQSGRIYYASLDFIYELEPVLGVPAQFSYQTKTIVVPTPINIGAAKIDADYNLSTEQIAAIQAAAAANAAANAALAASILADQTGTVDAAAYNEIDYNSQTVDTLPIPTDSPNLQFSIYLDDGATLFFTKNVLGSKAFRCPAGRKYDNFQVRVSGNIPVRAIVIGQTADELRTA